MKWNHCEEIRAEVAIHIFKYIRMWYSLKYRGYGAMNAPCMGSRVWLRGLCWSWKWEEGFECSVDQGSLEISAG